VDVAQTGVNFKSPGTATDIKVEFSYPVGALSNLTWTPSLPAGWVIASARTTNGTLGYVEVDGVKTSVVISAASGSLGASPLRFWITATVPGNQASLVAFSNANAAITFTPDAGTVMAAALGMSEKAACGRIHSADYGHRVSGRTVAGSDWVIDATEANRVLSYWRGGGYYITPMGLDGYAPGFVEGNVNSAKHSADYDGTVGQMSAEEAQRVIAYWKSGAYHVDVTGADGYAEGTTNTTHIMSLDMLGTTLAGASVTQSGPEEYDAGGTVTVNCTLNYAGRMLSLSWKPELPAGWQIVSVSGQGNPELVRGEVLWTSSAELPNPLVFSYTVQVPLWAREKVTLSSVARPMLQGFVNPLSVSASKSMTVKDADKNGIADGWEAHYFGANVVVDPKADADRDGMNNLDESIANTIPTESQSVLVMQSVDVNNGTAVLIWQSAIGKTYRVVAAETIDGTYVPLATGIATNTATVEMGSNKFLRVEVE